MKRFLCFVLSSGLTLGIAALLPLPAVADLKMDEIMTLVPADKTIADVMAPGLSPKVVEMSERLQQVAAKDPNWWREYAGQYPPGTPVPYHEKMEVTREEYLEFVELSARPSLIKYGEVLLEVSSPQQGVFRISAGDTVPEMDGIQVDLVRDRIETPFGQAVQKTFVNRDMEKQKLTGTWEGVQWEHLEVDTTAQKATSINFALGRLDESNTGILYYRVMRMTPREPPTEVMIVLNYPLREEQSD
jgi:hypothetical protein